jgi:hypothetical protein
VKDALAALTYDKEFWTDEVDRLSDDADRFDDAQAVRMLLRAVRIVRIEAPEDPRLEELLKRIFVKDIDEPSANFMYETLLATANRWEELEKHHLRRADKAVDHAGRIEALRTFALEWVQRFKDKDRGAKFFAAALQATASNGASAMRSIVAAFTLLRQVKGDTAGEWSQLLDLADLVIDRITNGEERLFLAIQAGHIAFDKVNDLGRAKKYFSIAAGIEPQNPNVQDFVQLVGEELPMASGSMPVIPVQKDDSGAARAEADRQAADAAEAQALEERAQGRREGSRGSSRSRREGSRGSSRSSREGGRGQGSDREGSRRSSRGRQGSSGEGSGRQGSSRQGGSSGSSSCGDAS